MKGTGTMSNFEHMGTHITNICETPCARAFLLPEQSADIYAPSIISALKFSAYVAGRPFNDLDALCLFVQNAIGLDDGGNAGIFWSDMKNGIECELHDETNSNIILDSIPDDILLEYVRSEIFYYFECMQGDNHD